MPSRSVRSHSWCLLAAALVASAIASAPLFAQQQPIPASPPSAADNPPIVSAPTDKDTSGNNGRTVKLRIVVQSPKGSPVANASVYVRHYEGGGMLHGDKLAEMDLKSNQDGTVKVPPIPQGKIQIQVIAQGWHTFGEWFDVEKDEQTITIALKEPPHWY